MAAHFGHHLSTFFGASAFKDGLYCIIDNGREREVGLREGGREGGKLIKTARYCCKRRAKH